MAMLLMDNRDEGTYGSQILGISKLDRQCGLGLNIRKNNMAGFMNTKRMF